MPQVTVEVNGRAYRLSCGEGEQDHVLSLSKRIDRHSNSITLNKAPANEGRNMLLAALMVADELHEKEQRVTALEEEVAALKAGGAVPAAAAAEGTEPDERIAEMEMAVAQMLDRAAAQIEVVTNEIEAVT